MSEKEHDKLSNSNSINSLITLKDAFLEWIKSKNYSSATLINRNHCLNYFCKWCVEREILYAKEITNELMQTYQRHILNRKKSNGETISYNSQSGYLYAIRLFCRWMVKNDHLLTDPTEKIPMPERPERLPSCILNPMEIETILNDIDISTNTGIRNRAILETFYSTGIRRTELSRLQISDVDLEQGILLVKEGKNSKDRVVPIGERAIKWIEKYLYQVRPQLLKDEKVQTLFLTQRGAGFAPHTLSLYITEYVSKVNKKGSCHIFRHSAATLMLENGADVRFVQDFLGHDNINSTQIYTRISINSLKEVHQKTHPSNIDCCETPQLEIKKEAPLRGGKILEEKIKFFEITSEQEQLKLFANKHLQWMQTSGLAFKTITGRQRYLAPFITWCEQRDIFAPAEVSKKIVLEYQVHISGLINPQNNRCYSARHRRHFLLSVSLFFRYLAQNSFILHNPAEVIELPKVPKNIPDILSEKEIKLVLSMPDISKPVGIRDRAILETFYSTAIRLKEMVGLNVEDIDFSRSTVFVRKGKGNKQRVVPISQSALDWIDQYLTLVRPMLMRAQEEKGLFITVTGQRINRYTIINYINGYLNAAGIAKKGAAHLFRHSAATHMLERGADLRYIQELLGHSSLSTTTIYTRVSIRKLKEVHAKTHPARMYPTKTEQILKELE